MPPPTPSPCSTCNAPLLWAKTVNNKNIPLDAVPRPDGNIVLEDGVAKVLSKTAMQDTAVGPRYTSHFVTCPDSKWHRK